MGAAELGLKDRPQTVLALIHVLVVMLGCVIIAQPLNRPRDLVLTVQAISNRHKKAQLGWAFGNRVRLIYDRLSVVRDEGQKIELGHSDNLSAGNFAVFEKHQRRDATHAKTTSDLGVVINVDFANFNTASKLSTNFFQNWSDHFARTTPRCPEV